MGDVKLLGAAAVWLDVGAYPFFLEMACAAALCFLLIRRVVVGEPLNPWKRLPFAAFLAPALWVALMLQLG
jgi:prepilin signal peptidase PulO-like enzyme (type II secretory pathway)